MSAVIARLEAALTPALARRAALALALASTVALAAWFITAPGGIRGDGAPLGADFVTFHAAGGLALKGALTSAYDTAAIAAAEKLSAPGETLTYLWRYPPTFALFTAPLATLPYLVAYALWSAIGLLAFISGLKRLLPGRDGWLLALGAPATFVCLLHGQSALLVAAAFAWGLALLEKRPLIAGAILGCLVCKPHFAIAPLLLLAVSGRWRALGGFAGCAALLCALSVVAFGFAPWSEFLRTAPQMAEVLAQGGLSWAKVPSAFTLALSLGLPQPVAWALQAACATIAVLLAALIWRSPGAEGLKGAACIAAALLISPYLFDYDLALLAVAAALAIRAGAMQRPGMRLALLLALATPALAPTIAKLTGVQLGVLPLAFLAAVVVRACWSEAMEILIAAYWSEANDAGSATGSSGPAKFTARVVG